MKQKSRMSRRIAALQALALPFLAASSTVAVAVPEPSAPPTADGNYSVTYEHCSDCIADWLEEKVGETGAWTALGWGAVTFSSKAEGQYHYRVGYAYLGPDYYYWDDYGPAITVVVASELSKREPLVKQMSYEYRVQAGDVDGDGREDLYVTRVKGGKQGGDGTLNRLVLRQLASGAFRARSASAADRTLASGWPDAQASMRLRDINVDGFVDLVLGDISSAVGADALDQIVYAPGIASNSVAQGVRGIDAAFEQFESDIVAYLEDPDYFLISAPLYVYSHTFLDLSCGTNYNDDYLIYGYFSSCYPVPITVVAIIPDYSGFDSFAVGVWSYEQAIETGLVSAEDGLDGIEGEIEEVLEVEVGGWDIEELLGEQSVSDGNVRRGIELFTSLVGISVANADEQDPAAGGQPDAVLITGRRVIGFGPLHTALQYQNTTISAYDNNDAALDDGILVSEVNWPPDHPLLTMKLGTVTGGLAPLGYWARLLEADSNYDDDLPYDALPSIGHGGYNSNGYTHGIILATNGVPSIAMGDFVGGELPVPASEFN